MIAMTTFDIIIYINKQGVVIAWRLNMTEI